MPAPQYILDRQSVRAVDAAAVNEFNIPSIVLMENAARGLADQALLMLEDAQASPAKVLIICGSGNNGGDGYALGRHIHNAGVKVTLVQLGQVRENTDAATNRNICLNMKLSEITFEDIDSHTSNDLIVDAIFGTGLDRPVAGLASDVINWINQQKAPVLAVDLPSGLDCDTGKPLGLAVKADCTVTFVARKPGMIAKEAEDYLGKVVVASIGAPIELIKRFGRLIE